MAALWAEHALSQTQPIAGASVPEIDPQSRIIFDCFYQHDPRVFASLFTKALAPLFCAFTLDGLAAVLAAVDVGDGFHAVPLYL